MNPYSTLGVARAASADTIKRAYKEKAKQHHPDRGGDATKFAEISNAYDILKDPDKRAYFDSTGSTNPQQEFQQPQGFNFNDIFSQVFRQQRNQTPEARIAISISLKDSVLKDEAGNPLFYFVGVIKDELGRHYDLKKGSIITETELHDYGKKAFDRKDYRDLSDSKDAVIITDENGNTYDITNGVIKNEAGKLMEEN